VQPSDTMQLCKRETLVIGYESSGSTRNHGHFANERPPSHVFPNKSSPLLVNETERHMNHLHRSVAAASPRSARRPGLAPWRLLCLALLPPPTVPPSVVCSASLSAADSLLCTVLVQPMDGSLHRLVLMIHWSIS
jgi:hypothetical protein